MQPLICMSLGAVIGWATGRALQDGGYDWFRDVVMGIGGVVVGGLLGISDGLGGNRGTVVTTMTALIAAVLFTMLVKRENPQLSYAWLAQAETRGRLNTVRPKALVWNSEPVKSRLRFAWSQH